MRQHLSIDNVYKNKPVVIYIEHIGLDHFKWLSSIGDDLFPQMKQFNLYSPCGFEVLEIFEKSKSCFAMMVWWKRLCFFFVKNKNCAFKGVGFLKKS